MKNERYTFASKRYIIKVYTQANIKTSSEYIRISRGQRDPWEYNELKGEGVLMNEAKKHTNTHISITEKEETKCEEKRKGPQVF